MNKAEMIKAVSDKMENTITQKDVDKVLSAYAEVVKETLASGNNAKIVLPELGTFFVKDVPERHGKIIVGSRKGEDYVVAAHKEPKFKMSKKFKEFMV